MAEEQVKVDAIVIGGGPAGMASALTMAREGLETILIERGETCGSKNVGGLVYGTVLNQLIPDACKKAPIERPVSKRELYFIGGEEHLRVDFGAEVWSKPPFNNTYVVHRAQFDKWFSSEVEKAGASLLEGMVADDLIYETNGTGKKAVGVKIQGDEEFRSDVVILADGANGLVSQKAVQELNFRTGKHPQEYVVGVKEIIRLPKEKIEDRFHLNANEGVAIDFFGVPFEGVVGGGFIYTAKDTLHVGFAARTDSIVRSRCNPSDVMDRFKRHPEVQKYLHGGELVEYSAHLIPEGGYDAIGQLSGNGVMIAGDGAGFVNMSLYKEGTNHAMESGKFAGETAVAAKKKNDFSAAALSQYEEKLKGSTVMKDMKKYRRVPQVLAGTPGLFSLYPKKMANLMIDYFTVTEASKSKQQWQAILNFLKGLPKFRFVYDMIRAKNMC